MGLPSCQRCNLIFYTNIALWQHEDRSRKHHRCTLCNQDFLTPAALNQHYIQSPDHHYCQRCNRHFDELSELDKHYDEDHYYCGVCRQMFEHEDKLHDHRRSKHPEQYCFTCKRIFAPPVSLVQHQCTPLHHQTGPGVSNPGGGNPNAPSSAISVAVWATDHTWNGKQHECYVCHREFASLPGLHEHLRGPTHAQRRYRCPCGRWQGCGAEFGTLTALWQHMDSRRCEVRRLEVHADAFFERYTRRWWLCM